jgi:uncharacterized membrane protein YgcG
VAGTIQPHSAAGIRGHIFTKDGLPLEAVKVTIAGHSELGATVSRYDGGYDMVVNGGGTSVVHMSKAGYLPVDRTVYVPWQGFGQVEDIVMITTDPHVVVVDLSQQALQVAAGSVIVDEDGTRQATVLVLPGTQATMDLSDGTTAPLNILSIRATEYTVGRTGPAAMPAPLPSGTVYTYAVDYTVDEALAVGAKMVHFSQPLYHYSENFIGFPVGSPVPAGYYDTARHLWVPAQNGTVVRILSIDGGTAQLDVDGSGNPVPSVVKQSMGITDSELSFLASRYQPGQTLWRVPIGHFTVWDFNRGGTPPAGAGPPVGSASSNGSSGGCTDSCCMPASGGSGGDGSGSGGDGSGSGGDGSGSGGGGPSAPQQLYGSIIETQRQVLGERVGIVGTPFSLNYRTLRVEGFKAAYEMHVKLTGESVPASMSKLKLSIDVAGRRLQQDFVPAPSLGFDFLWDGKDSLGRTLNGIQVASTRLCAEYPLVYTDPPGGDSHAWISFGAYPDSVTLAGQPGRTTMTTCQDLPVTDTQVGTYLAKGAGLGAWTVSVNHVYDFGGVLWRGDGEREEGVVRSESDTVLIPGYYANSYLIAPTADGSFYLTGQSPSVTVSTGGLAAGEFWKVNPVTGQHSIAFTTNVMPSSESGCAWYTRPVTAIATAPDGSIYFSTALCSGAYNGAVFLDHVGSAGNFLGSWMVAQGMDYTNYKVAAISVGSDGTAYFLDETGSCLRLRKLEADGRVTTVTGTAPSGGNCASAVASGDGGPAKLANFKGVNGAVDLATGKDGSLYISNQSECRVRRIWPSGIIDTVAGSTCPSPGAHTGDGGPATAAKMSPSKIAIGGDDVLVIGDDSYWTVPCTNTQPGCANWGNGTYIVPRTRIRTVFAGIIESIAGQQVSYSPEGSPALQKSIGILNDLEVGPDRGVYYVEYTTLSMAGLYQDGYPNAIRRILKPMPVG